MVLKSKKTLKKFMYFNKAEIINKAFMFFDKALLNKSPFFFLRCANRYCTEKDFMILLKKT